MAALATALTAVALEMMRPPSQPQAVLDAAVAGLTEVIAKQHDALKQCRSGS